MADLTCQLLVLGAGPGGYVCAIRAGQLGVDTIIVDAATPGGTCLNIGCIPSKALIHAGDEFHRLTQFEADSPLGISAKAAQINLARTVEWKNSIVERLTNGVTGLLKKAGVKIVSGHGTFLDGKTLRVETSDGAKTIKAETVVIATGSRPIELPGMPFGGRVISSTEALSLTEIPKKLTVVGAGYIGLEIGTAYAKLGSVVTIIEAAKRILPQYDSELTRPVSKRMQKLNVTVHTGFKVTGFDEKTGTLHMQSAAGAPESVESDLVLVAAGRVPQTTGYALEQLHLEMDGPFLRIDDKCRTSMRGTFAIGDITGEPMLAHRAMAQGEMVAEIVAGKNRGWDKRCIPAVCFTDPEIVSVGILPDDAKQEGWEIATSVFPFSANGKSLISDDGGGFIRITCRADNHLILGIQAVGAGISELSAAFSLAIENGCVAEDLAGTIQAHPTKGEALQEAAAGVFGKPVHFGG